MLQRGFKCPASGKRPSVWVYQKSGAAFRRRTEKFGGEDEFYSPPSDGTTRTLDDRITEWEAHRQKDVRAWRQSPGGTAVDAQAAAELVGLTGVRTLALRESFKTLFQELMPRFAGIMQDPDVLMTHLDAHPEMDTGLERLVAAELGLTPQALEAARSQPEFQAVMRMLKYGFSDVLGHRLANALRDLDRIFADAFSNDAFNATRLHGEAIGRLLDEGGVQQNLLGLSWSVHARTNGLDWVLPDCAVLTVDADGAYSPFLFGGQEDRVAVLLPLSPQRMLVGLEPGHPLPDLEQFTAQAARCAQQFFLAPQKTDALERLQPFIGETEWGQISDGLETILSGIDPLRTTRETDPIPGLANMDVSAHGLALTEAELRDIAEPLCQLVFSTTRHFNLTRVTKIVVCGHVASAIGARIGDPDFAYADGDTRALIQWIECGEGELAYELFIHADGVQMLHDADHEAHDFAFSLFLQSLAQIHTRAVLTSASHTLDDSLDRLTQSEVGVFARNTALNAAGTFMDNLHGSQIEPVGDDFTANTATRLTRALDAFRAADLPREGSETVRHQQAETLAEAAAEVLVCASRHLAICQTRAVDPLNPAFAPDALMDHLTALSLREWFARLDFDLQRLRVNFAAPLDPERIIALQRHLECLFWARGAILIASDEGGYILPFAESGIDYAALRAQLQDAVAGMLPDNLAEEFENLLR